MKNYIKPEIIFSSSPINTTLSESDIVELKNCEEEIIITVQAQGIAGDSDTVEIYRNNSSEGTKFETSGTIEKIGEYSLDGSSLVRKVYKLETITPYFKIGVKMQDGSTETPTVRMSVQKTNLLCN